MAGLVTWDGNNMDYMAKKIQDELKNDSYLQWWKKATKNLFKKEAKNEKK